MSWLHRHGRWLALGLITLFSLGGWALYQAQKDQQQREDCYLAAPHLVQQLQTAALRQKNDLFEQSLFELQKTLALLPDLKIKYDGLLAQDLLLEHRGSCALPYGTHALQRSEALLPPLYYQFSQTSLLIGQGLYQEALVATQKLEEDLLAAVQTPRPNFEALSILYAMTLVRKAMLHQNLGTLDQELQAWGQIKNLISSTLDSPLSHESARLWLAEHFSYGSLSLLDYIQSRQDASSASLSA